MVVVVVVGRVEREGGWRKKKSSLSHLTEQPRTFTGTLTNIRPILPSPEQGEPEPEMDNTAMVSDPGSSHYLPGHSKPYDPRAAADAQESMKAKVVAIRRKLVEQVSAEHTAANPRCAVCHQKFFWGGGLEGGLERHKGALVRRLRSCMRGWRRVWGGLLLQVLFAV